MSTTKAEYRSLADCAKEVHLRRLLLEPRLLTVAIMLTCSDSPLMDDISNSFEPTEIDVYLNYDNTSTLKLARNPIFHAKSKHIELQHHFIRERILQLEISVSYVKMNDQTADIFTKALSATLFKHHKFALGIQSLDKFEAQRPLY